MAPSDYNRRNVADMVKDMFLEMGNNNNNFKPPPSGPTIAIFLCVSFLIWLAVVWSGVYMEKNVVDMDLKSKAFSHDNFNINSAIYSLARVNDGYYTNYIKLVRHSYKNEDDLTVWKLIIEDITYWKSILNSGNTENTEKLFEIYIYDLLSNTYNKLGWDPLPNEDTETSMLHSLILIQLGINGNNKIRDEAHKRFQKLLNNNNQHHQSINLNINAAIYLTVAKTGNEEIFKQLKSLYRKADTQEEKIHLLVALCRFDDENIQRQALEFIWNKNEVRKEYHLTGFVALALHNRKGCELTWKYMQDNWDKIEDIYREHESYLIHFVEYVPRCFATEQRLEEVAEFYIDHSNELLRTPVKEVLEVIAIRRLLLEHNEQSINEYLNNEYM